MEVPKRPWQEVLSSDAYAAFWQQHAHLTAEQIVLKKIDFEGLGSIFLAQQLLGRSTAATKLPTWAANMAIAFPPTLNLGQASWESTARWKADLLAGRAIADLTGGTGVDSYFLRQKASKLLYSEPNEVIFSIGAHNVSQITGSPLETICMAAEDIQPEDLDGYHTIYLDPSRRKADGSRVVALVDLSPDLTRLNVLKQWQGEVLLKLPPALDLSALQLALPWVQKIWVLSIGNEVKEIIALGKPSHAANKPSITAEELDWNGNAYRWPQADRMQAETLTTLQFAEPEVGQYLLEPGAAVLKAGLQDAMHQNLCLSKCHPNTHLYLSRTIVPNYFGKVYEVLSIVPADLKAIAKTWTGKGVQITTRNFGLKPEEIAKRAKLKSGSDGHLLFFSTLVGHYCASVLRVAAPNR